MAARSKALAIGSAGWILEERHQSNNLVSQELEDFGFTVRNELEWLNEHMADICANPGQHNLDVFKTPGKLRGKTPRTARKKNQAQNRQPLAHILAANALKSPSLAEQSLRINLQKHTTKARFQIAEDVQITQQEQPVVAKPPVARQLFSKAVGLDKENVDSSFHTDAFERPIQHSTAPWSPVQSTQDTVMISQEDDVFSPPRTQSTQQTQPTQPTQSFRKSIHDENERRDTGESFVSAKEAFGSRNPSRETLPKALDAGVNSDDMQADTSRSDAQDTVIRHNLSLSDEDDVDMQDLADFPEPPRVISEQYSISAETDAALHTASTRALAPEPKTHFMQGNAVTPATYSPVQSQADVHDDSVVHHDVDDVMDIDDDVRSPSEGSSPVKPLVRKSSLTFASLPAREPLLAKKSMGNRVSRTSHVDPSKTRNSHLGRFTGGKSMGGSQITQPTDMDVDMERPELQREESETTKIHNKTTTQRLFERINMLKQQSDAAKPASQNVLSSQSSQAQSFSATQPKEDGPSTQPSQPAYPVLNATQGEIEDDDDDWISPVRPAAVASKVSRPALNKSHTVDLPPSPAKSMHSKLVSASNPDLTTTLESTTPAGSPTGRRYMDGPLSASKSKLYSAFRAAKEKLIGSSATSAQAKLDALNDSPRRPMLYTQDSSEDIFTSPKRTEKAPSMFSHLRSPSKESLKSTKSSKTTASRPDSPVKEAGRRTRSSSEREKQKERETREREAKEAKESRQQQRAEEKLREMREKEQSKAMAAHQKTKLATKTPSAMSSQSSLKQPTAASTKTPVSTQPQQTLSRPGTARTNSKDQDMDSADEMPPPPPPKSLLPTTKTTKAALREPRKLVKPTTKETAAKAKAPQKIMVNLNSSRYGQAPPPAARPAPTTTTKPLPPAPQATSRPAAPAPKLVQASTSRPASAMSKVGPSSKAAQAAPKAAAQRVARPQPQAMEKPKAPAAQPRADLGAARPVSRMQTVQDANRINVPPVNPAKPPKRPFQGESEETIHRPAKRPSQLAKMNPITPAHAQFAKGKIPFAEPAHAPQPQVPQIQYPNGEDIKLPDIMTDSEDEDSENEFEQPSWVNTPNLREMLSNQQLMDPESIFGPIPPLEMEKVFPNKERHKRFRERTSSAYWANDQVTEEEKRKEREARERLARDGAWTYNPSPRPAASSR